MANDWWKKVGKVVQEGALATAEVVKETAVSTADAVRTTAGVGVGSIAMEVSQTGYKPGDMITGVVVLNLEEETEAEKLVVRLVATGSRTRMEKVEGNRSVVRDNETLYSFDLEVAGEKTYPSGESRYDFSLKIPTDADPEDSVPKDGFLGDVAKAASLFGRGVKQATSWKLRTFLHIPWKRNLKKELDIQVDAPSSGEEPT